MLYVWFFNQRCRMKKNNETQLMKPMGAGNGWFFEVLWNKIVAVAATMADFFRHWLQEHNIEPLDNSQGARFFSYLRIAGEFFVSQTWFGPLAWMHWNFTRSGPADPADGCSRRSQSQFEFVSIGSCKSCWFDSHISTTEHTMGVTITFGHIWILFKIKLRFPRFKMPKTQGCYTNSSHDELIYMMSTSDY
jgi:hypothetical protein